MSVLPTFPIGSSLDDHLTARLLLHRIIVVGAEIDDAVANRTIAQVLLLSAEDPRADISIHIRSTGGAVAAGLAVYDTMQVIPNHVSTVAVANVSGIGLALLCAGTPGKRYALPNARLLMRQPSARVELPAGDIATQAENLEHSKRQLAQVIADHTSQPLDVVTADADQQKWFTAEQARDYGMVDQLVESVDTIRPTSSSRKVGL